MPGSTDSLLTKASFYTNFALYRENINPTAIINPYDELVDGPVFPTIPELDLSRSLSGFEGNRIFLLLKRTDAGAHIPCTVKLYFQTVGAHTDVNAEWILMKEEIVAKAGTSDPEVAPILLDFTDLYAGKYKIALENVAGGIYNIYESHTGEQVQLG